MFFTDPIFTDNSGNYTVSYSHGSGSFFNLGSTEVVYSAIDPSNNIKSDTFLVIIQANTPPVVLSSISNYTFDSLGIVTWDEAQLVFDDNCSDELSYTLSHHSLDTFNIGTTTVTGTVTDESNNVTSFTFQIKVEDIVDPEFDSIPLDFSVYLVANAGCEAPVIYSPATATDDYSDVVISYSIESGTLLDVGVHDIVITATDSSGNSIEETIQLEVKDTISPIFTYTPANISVGICENTINYDLPEVSDNCGIQSLVRITGLPSGSNFPTGGHTIEYRATDVNGNIANVSFEVIVTESTPPFITGVQVGCSENDPFELGAEIDNIVFSGPGIDENVFDPSVSGNGIHNVSWIWTDDFGCEYSGNMEMIINQTPPMPIIIQSNILQLSVHNAYNTYQWYRNGVIMEGETNVSMNFNMGGNYEVIVGNESDCFVLSRIFKIGIGTYPSLSLEDFESEGLIISPNPSNGIVSITSFIELDQPRIEVVNLLGQTQFISTYEQTGPNQIRLDLQELPIGIYTLKVSTQKGLLSKKMIIK